MLELPFVNKQLRMAMNKMNSVKKQFLTKFGLLKSKLVGKETERKEQKLNVRLF